MEQPRNLHRDEIADQLIDFMTEGSEGRLIVFRHQGLGSDLEVQPRGNYKALPLRFSLFEVIETGKGVFSCDIDTSRFTADPRLYFFFVRFDPITQRTDRSFWIISSEDFFDAAKAPAAGMATFRAELNANDSYAPFYIKAEDLGKYIDDLFTGRENLSRKTVFTKSEKINQQALYEFIGQARANTYANDQMPLDRPKLPGTLQWEFQKGPWLYLHSRFEGAGNVMGQEIVYQNQTPIWGMEYEGLALQRMETIFLKEVLLKYSAECRFGKQVSFQKRELEYIDKGEGDFESFSGKEQLLASGKELYRLSYNGGMLQDNL